MALKKNNSSFGNPIKLAMSGGGFRASAFHLGTLSYLDRAGIIKEVDTLSTVSGGSITGMGYALCVRKGESFEKFFSKMYAFLRDTNILEKSMHVLGKDSDHTLSGDYNLSTSYAELYNELITGGERFGIFWKKPPIHLKEIVFNATEFRSGLAFRFQKSDNPNAKIGSGRYSIPPESAKLLRLADILAASTCVPGGCEPMAFPEDFSWPDGNTPAEVLNAFPGKLPLMDGGVYDNQGIESAILADERSGNRIGAFIISDVDLPEQSIYRFPRDRRKGFITIGMLNSISMIITALLLGSSIALFFDFLHSFNQEGFRWIRDLFHFALPASLTVLFSLGLLWLRGKFSSALERFSPEIGINAWKSIRKLTLNQFWDMAELRITSLITLTSDVFMKRIRGLLYNIVYTSPAYNDKRISNLIYDISSGKKEHAAPWLVPSPELIRISRKASEMPTTFWFTDKNDLRDITACGQFTMCYNLIEFILRQKKRGKAMNALLARARKDWERFMVDPYFMVGV